MTIDFDELQQLAVGAFEVLTIRVFGAAGGQALRGVITSVRRVYSSVDPSVAGGKVIVFQRIEPHEANRSGRAATPLNLQAALAGDIVLEVHSDGDIEFASTTESAEALSEHAVVYEYSAGSERIYARFENRQVPNVLPGKQSSFAMPTFVELKDALETYATKLASASQCRILRTAWFDDHRFYLKRGPEEIMRQSLEQFLRGVLPADVMPEQNVDETHPVDIRVTYDLPKRVALIEIKWLGKSRHANADEAAEFSEYRARDGARQLAEYLDSHRAYVSGVALRGYLVVFDARRRNLKPETVSLSRADGLYFRDREIAFDPAYHDVRDDFEQPIRMFVEPECELT
jgi:hypothetical protein